MKPCFVGGEMGVYARINVSLFLDFGSASRIMRCWPMGNPRVWSSWSSWKVKMRVSGETEVLECRVAFFHERGLRKVGVASVSLGDASLSDVRADMPASFNEPIW